MLTVWPCARGGSVRLSHVSSWLKECCGAAELTALLHTVVQRFWPGFHVLSFNRLQVKSRVAVLNQRHPERTIWKESAICTKTWNSSVLQLIDVSLCTPFAHNTPRTRVCLLLEQFVRWV